MEGPTTKYCGIGQKKHNICYIGGEVKVRAMRRMGEMLDGMEKNKGQLYRGNQQAPRDNTPTIDDLGVFF